MNNLHFFATGFRLKGVDEEFDHPIWVSGQDIINAIKNENEILPKIDGHFVEKWLHTIHMACLGREFLPKKERTFLNRSPKRPRLDIEENEENVFANLENVETSPTTSTITSISHLCGDSKK